MQERGAGEIVLNCMASDGVRTGYDLAQLRAVRAICRVPLIASGGAGAPEHFAAVFAEARVDGALAASVFHSGAIAIGELKALPARRSTWRSDHERPATCLRQLDWGKGDGLLPAVIQDAQQRPRADARLHESRSHCGARSTSGRVVFYSRSRNELWTKGETSGHYLDVVHVSADCDDDTILVLATRPDRPATRAPRRASPMRARPDASRIAFLASLEATIARRIAESPKAATPRGCTRAGIGRIAQKVGEEGVETALAAVTREDDELIGECADLLYHLLVLLKARNLSLDHVVQELASRHASKA